jgi:hypothetical protein
MRLRWKDGEVERHVIGRRCCVIVQLLLFAGVALMAVLAGCRLLHPLQMGDTMRSGEPTPRLLPPQLAMPEIGDRPVLVMHDRLPVRGNVTLVAPTVSCSEPANENVIEHEPERAESSMSGTQEASARWRSFKVGDEVVDEDGERCRIRSIDPEDAEKPYELEYPSGAVYWAAPSGISELA